MKRLIKTLKWFYPGLKIKRWVFFIILGLVLILISTQYNQNTYWDKVIASSQKIVGTIFVILSVIFLIMSILEVITPYNRKELIDIIYEKRFLAKGPRIVVIGGGTGLSTILAGLKEYTSNISAIVTVADEGGSSGKLREEFGILPPGDIRNCLVSLAEAPQLMRDLFQYRFSEGGGIKGHSFGNLFITAMTQITGSFNAAIKESSEILAIRGKVLPSTLDIVRLQAEYDDGTVCAGEDKIPQLGKVIKKIVLIPQNPQPNPEAVKAIKEAELIILGPGSLFTSVLPNLLIGDITSSIVKKNVLKIYICNIMTQKGETQGFTASQHLKRLVEHTSREIINCCIVNSGGLNPDLLKKYAKDNSFPVVVDREEIAKMGIVVFEGNLVNATNYLHHDPYRTAKKIMDIYNIWRSGRWIKLRGTL